MRWWCVLCTLRRLGVARSVLFCLWLTASCSSRKREVGLVYRIQEASPLPNGRDGAWTFASFLEIGTVFLFACWLAGWL